MMIRNRISTRFMLQSILLSAVLLFLFSPTQAIADSDHHFKKRSKEIGEIFNHPAKSETNEAAGQAAAWLFAVANIGVLISVTARGIAGQRMPIPDNLKTAIKRFNQRQKKWLMPLHYALNPIALLLAFIHFLSASSACKASGLPEWGLVLLALITGIGIMLKWKLFPRHLLKNTYQIHTNPIPFALLCTLLLIGHAIVD